MKKTLFLLSLLSCSIVRAQDTFSIVAVDTITGEVGAAGASCVDLFTAGLPTDDFLSELFPGVGAINTQAAYLPANQINARTHMNAGELPQQIIDWLVANDAQSMSETRQYGIVRIVGSSSQSTAHTGSSCINYANHITGPNYAIQGNILLDASILEAMETNFNNAEGDLSCKLMAALQGANVVGADSRCASDGTSSLFAFVKVSQPGDAFGSPSFLLSVRTHDNSGIEPIDSLQVLFDQNVTCGSLGIENADPDPHQLYPNPATQSLTLYSAVPNGITAYRICDSSGKVVAEGRFQTELTLATSGFASGFYTVEISYGETRTVRKLLIGQ